MAFKVFTNGSTLQASEVNDNLMRQAVSTFTNAAARTAAITAPSEGMLTYLEDVDRYDHWNSGAWVSPFGLTKIASQTFSAVSSVSFNNVFSSSYKDYFIVFTGVASAAQDIQYRMRTAGSDLTTNIYTAGRLYITNLGGPTRAYSSAQNTSRIGEFQIYRSMMCLNICDPFVTTTTTHNAQVTSFGNNDYLGSAWGYVSTAASYDGISFIPAGGTITGTITVYGYRS